jgi:hypothetical protein
MTARDSVSMQTTMYGWKGASPGSFTAMGV